MNLDSDSVIKCILLTHVTGPGLAKTSPVCLLEFLIVINYKHINKSLSNVNTLSPLENSTISSAWMFFNP